MKQFSQNGQVMILTVVAIGGTLLAATTVAGLLVVYQLRQSSDAVNLQFAISSSQLQTLPIGLYDVEIARVSDGQKTTYAKQILVTKLGDIWSPTANESAEQKRDGRINIFDVSRLLSKWGKTGVTDLAEADINAGPANISLNKIDLYDANKLMSNWTSQ